jgi:uncharacterized protein with FMN-binding domain
MNNGQLHQSQGFPRVIRKFLLSGFVVFSFIAYTLHKPYANDSGLTGVTTTQTLANPLVLNSTNTPSTDTTTATQASSASSTPPAAASDIPQQALTPTLPAPTNTAIVNGYQYKNGTFNGPSVDAFYGNVQVQVVIQNGKISNVQFLTYPTDRRTSARINSIAVPYLQQEAITAQSANVDIISGATLTSQAFVQSLQAALNQAKG